MGSRDWMASDGRRSQSSIYRINQKTQSRIAHCAEQLLTFPKLTLESTEGAVFFLAWDVVEETDALEPSQPIEKCLACVAMQAFLPLFDVEKEVDVSQKHLQMN